MIVAIIAATGPKPKRNSTGTRYAKIGTVCIKSSIGMMMISARRLRNEMMPKVRPRATPIGTAMTMEDSVTIALSHWPNTAK